MNQRGSTFPNDVVVTRGVYDEQWFRDPNNETSAEIPRRSSDAPVSGHVATDSMMNLDVGPGLFSAHGGMSPNRGTVPSRSELMGNRALIDIGDHHADEVIEASHLARRQAALAATGEESRVTSTPLLGSRSCCVIRPPGRYPDVGLHRLCGRRESGQEYPRRCSYEARGSEGGPGGWNCSVSVPIVCISQWGCRDSDGRTDPPRPVDE